jgi:hypothetical protein
VLVLVSAGITPLTLSGVGLFVVVYTAVAFAAGATMGPRTITTAPRAIRDREVLYAAPAWGID